MGKRLLGFAIAATIAAGLIAAYELALRSGRGGESSPLYSARRHDPYGTAALADLLAERGVEVRYLERPHLDDADRGVLIQVLPLAAARSTGRGFGTGAVAVQGRQLIDWIGKGNTVIQFSRAETEMLDHFLPPSGKTTQAAVPTTELSDHFLPPSTLPPPGRRSEAVVPSPEANEIERHEAAGGLPSALPGALACVRWTPSMAEMLNLKSTPPQPMSLRSPLRLTIGARSAMHPLAVADGQVVAAESRFGQGRMIFVGAPTPVLNGGLNDGGNLDFILAVVGKGPVILDEWSHGIGREDSIMGAIRRFGLLPFVFQVIFLLSLYIWSTRARPSPERVQLGRWPANIEQIKTLGHLYSRTFSREETSLRVRQEVLRRLAAALRCPAAEAEHQLARLEPAEAARIRALLSLTAHPSAGRRPIEERALAESLTQSHRFLEEKSRGRSIA